MEKDNKILIMFVGKTHSGKTTFAKELKKEAEDVLILEADPIAAFMKNEFPDLRMSDDDEHAKLFENLTLKFRTFLLFIEFSLSLGKPIILSNSNMTMSLRESILNLSKKFNYRTVGVYFDFPEELLLNRVQNSNRETIVLRKTVSFKELVIKQRDRMQMPTPSEFDEFFTINSQDSLELVKQDLIKML